jgi:hypothetical protein
MDIYLPSVKNYHRNIKYMPVAIFFVRLDLEKNSSFLDRHYLARIFTRPGWRVSFVSQGLRASSFPYEGILILIPVTA